MDDSETSDVLALPLSRNTRSARLKEDERYAKGANRKQYVPPTLTGDSKPTGRGLTWAENVQDGDTTGHIRPFSAAAYAHSLHPLATLSAAKYAKLSDLEMHVLGAMEHKDSHRDLLAETMERMAKHNDRLKMEAVRLRAANHDRAARTIQLYWRLYKERLREHRKQEKRRGSTWMETVRQRRPQMNGESDEEEEEEEEEEERPGTSGRAGCKGEKVAKAKKSDKKPETPKEKKKKKKVLNKAPDKDRTSGDSPPSTAEGLVDGANNEKKKRKGKKGRKGTALDGDGVAEDAGPEVPNADAAPVVLATEANERGRKRRKGKSKKRTAPKTADEKVGDAAVVIGSAGEDGGSANQDGSSVLDIGGEPVLPSMSWTDTPASQLSSNATTGPFIDKEPVAVAATAAEATATPEAQPVIILPETEDDDEESEEEEAEEDEEEEEEEDDGIYDDDEPSEEVDDMSFQKEVGVREDQEGEGALVGQGREATPLPTNSDPDKDTEADGEASEGEDLLVDADAGEDVVAGEDIDAREDSNAGEDSNAETDSGIDIGPDDEDEVPAPQDQGDSLVVAQNDGTDADAKAAAAEAAAPDAAAAARLAAEAAEAAAPGAAQPARRHQPPRPERDPAALQVHAWELDLPDASTSQRRYPPFHSLHSAKPMRFERRDGGRGHQTSASSIGANATQTMALMQLQSDARNIPSLLRIIDPTAAAVAAALVATAPSSPMNGGSAAAIAAAAAAAARLPGRVRAVSGSGYYSRPHSLSFLHILSPSLGRLSPVRRIKHHTGSPPAASPTLFVRGLRPLYGYSSLPLLRRARSSEPIMSSSMFDDNGAHSTGRGSMGVEGLMRSLGSPRASYSLSVELSQGDEESSEVFSRQRILTAPELPVTQPEIEQLLGDIEEVGGVRDPLVLSALLEAVATRDVNIGVTSGPGYVANFGGGVASASGGGGGSSSAPASPLLGSSPTVSGVGTRGSTYVAELLAKPASEARRPDACRGHKQTARLRQARTIGGETSTMHARSMGTASIASNLRITPSAMRSQQRHYVMASVVNPGLGDADAGGSGRAQHPWQATGGGRSGAGDGAIPDGRGFGLTPEASFMSTRSVGPPLAAERSAPALLQGGAYNGNSTNNSNLTFRYRADVLREVFALAHVDPGQLLQRVLTPPRGLRGKPLASTTAGLSHHLVQQASPPPSQPTVQAIDLAQQVAALLRQPGPRGTRRDSLLFQHYGFPSWSSARARQPRSRVRSLGQSLHHETPTVTDCYPTTTTFGPIGTTAPLPPPPRTSGTSPPETQGEVAAPLPSQSSHSPPVPPPEPDELGVVLEVGRELALREVERNGWSRSPRPAPGLETYASLARPSSGQLGVPMRRLSDSCAIQSVLPAQRPSQLVIQGISAREPPHSPRATGGVRSPGERASMPSLHSVGSLGGGGNGRLTGASLSVLATKGSGDSAVNGVGGGTGILGNSGGGAIAGGDLAEGLVGLPMLPLLTGPNPNAFLLTTRMRTTLHSFGHEPNPPRPIGSARRSSLQATAMMRSALAPDVAVPSPSGVDTDLDLYRRSSEPPSVAASTMGGDSWNGLAGPSIMPGPVWNSSRPFSPGVRTQFHDQKPPGTLDNPNMTIPAETMHTGEVGCVTGGSGDAAVLGSTNVAIASHSDGEAGMRRTPAKAQTHVKDLCRQAPRGSNTLLSDADVSVPAAGAVSLPGSVRVLATTTPQGRANASMSHWSTAVSSGGGGSGGGGGGGAAAAGGTPAVTIGASWPPPMSSPRLEAVGSSISGASQAVGTLVQPQPSSRSPAGGVNGGSIGAPPALPAAAAWTIPHRHPSVSRRRKAADLHSNSMSGRVGVGSARSLSPGPALPTDRSGRYTPYGELLGPTSWLQRVGPPADPPLAPAPSLTTGLTATTAADMVIQGQGHGQPTQLPQLCNVKSFGSFGSDKRMMSLEGAPAKPVARGGAAVATVLSASTRDTVAAGGLPPTIPVSAGVGPGVAAGDDWHQSGARQLPSPSSSPSTASAAAAAAAAMGTGFSTARYFDASSRGAEGGSRGLPNVPPPPTVTTRLIVRRPAPVLRLPVVAAAQAAASHNTPRGSRSPGTAAMGVSGSSSPMNCTLGSTGMTSNSQQLAASVSCDGMEMSPDGKPVSSSALSPRAGSSTVLGTGRSLSPDTPYTSEAGGLKVAPSYMLTSEASKTSVVTDSVATPAGGSGGGGSSRAAAREWRGLERWWQAKGLDEAVIQIHRQPVSGMRTVFL